MHNQRVPPNKMEELKKIQPVKFAWALFFDYFIISICLITAHYSLSYGPLAWFSWPALWIIVASRQHAILVLMHETAHGTAFQNKTVNEFFGETLCSIPFFITMKKYRRDHLAHHKWCNSKDDPDWVRKIGNEEERLHWSFPIKKTGIIYWIRLWYASVIYQFGSISRINSVRNKENKFQNIAKVVFFILAALTLIYTNLWIIFALFWVFPFVIVSPLLLRLRSVAEHFGLEYESEYSETRNVIFSSHIENFIFAPHNISFHLVHHLYADVPFYSLNSLHRLLMDNDEYAQKSHNNDGYFLGKNPVFRDLKNRKPMRKLWEEDYVNV